MLTTLLTMTGPVADLLAFGLGMFTMVGLPITHEYLKQRERGARRRRLDRELEQEL